VSFWKWGPAVLVIAVAVFLFALQPGESLDPTLAGRPGASLYEEHCLQCHGGRGDGPKASRMADHMVDFTSAAFADTASLATVRHTVTRGKGRMKGYAAKLSPDQIDAVSRFVLELRPPWE
jgi:mono/diheme cytochrome c family protein